jgi:DNA polymerase-3 subunit beta
MKIFLERKILLKALSHAQSVVERKNTIPILSNVLLDATSGKLVISATDLDILTRETVEADIQVAGAVTVPAHLFFDIVRKMPEGARIGLEMVKDRLAVSAGRSRFQLPTLSQNDFPTIAAGELTCSFSISAEEMSRLLSRARYAMSQEETRYYLQGIFLHLTPEDAGGGRLRAVSTDGHRLALVTALSPEIEGVMPEVIVPRKCVGEVAKIIDDIEDDIVIRLSGTKICFEMGSFVLLSKVVDGTFPAYQRVIPHDNDLKVRVSADLLAEGIDRVSTVSSDKTKIVKVTASSGKLLLSVSSPDFGTAVEEVEADYAGPEIVVGFNSRYLLDTLAQQKRQIVEIELKDGQAPALFRKIDEPFDLSVLMPVRC